MQRVLVTGGSQGIGLGIAIVFARAGARVVITGRNEQRLTEAASSAKTKGLQLETVAGDVATRQSCQAMADKAITILGGLDVLCANAGIYPETQLVDMTEQDLDSMLSVNLKGTVFSVQACVDALTAAEHGRVVVTSSITGPATGYPGLSHYGASKAAQLGFVRSAALELAPRGITINAVLPGSIRTEGLDGLGIEAIEAMERCIPQRRLGSVEDIGYAALYFASPQAGFVTGQTLVVDGGQTLPELPLLTG